MAVIKRTKLFLGPVIAAVCLVVGLYLVATRTVPTAETNRAPALQSVAGGSGPETPGLRTIDAVELSKGIADHTHLKTIHELLEIYGFWSRLSPLLPLLGIDTEEVVEEFRVENHAGYRLWAVELPGFRGFGLRADSGIISGFGDRGEARQIPKDWKVHSCVPSQSLLDRARAVIRALGLPYKVSLNDFRYDQELNKGFGGWWLSVVPEYQGLKGGGLFRLAFSAYSGKIIRLSNAPLITPKSMVQNVIQDDAIKTATGVIDQGNIRFDTEKPAATLCIVYPNGYWGSRIENTDHHETRLAWRVFFGGDGGDRQAWVDVDAGTGEIVGGGQYL